MPARACAGGAADSVARPALARPAAPLWPGPYRGRHLLARTRRDTVPEAQGRRVRAAACCPGMRGSAARGRLRRVREAVFARQLPRGGRRRGNRKEAARPVLAAKDMARLARPGMCPPAAQTQGHRAGSLAQGVRGTAPGRMPARLARRLVPHQEACTFMYPGHAPEEKCFLRARACRPRLSAWANCARAARSGVPPASGHAGRGRLTGPRMQEAYFVRPV